MAEEFFEGPEKTLEVVFHPGFGIERGLKALTREQLDTLCELAKCSILSQISSKEVDAYILSESSLFIYEYKFIMKTCGTTTLLHCLQTLLEYTDALEMVLVSLNYFRKNLNQPDSQIHPHHSFESEIEYINTHAQLEKRLHSKSFILGPLNSDHLFVYMAHICPLEKVSMDHYIKSVSSNVSTSSKAEGSQGLALDKPRLGIVLPNKGSLNLMMFGLDPSFCNHFYEENSASAKEMTQKSGISNLILGTIVDEKAFSPCGYSMNAISNNYYYTVHITPQESCSYASFETNLDVSTTSHSFICNILSVFRPTSFVLTFFTESINKPFKEISNLPYYKCSSSSTVKLDSGENCYMANFLKTI